ncbi:MAG: T9SS type A sorting domain-containing protein [bacterium]
MNEGNPAPCAAFPGTPSHSTYIYALQSPWFDATQLTCDKLFLDFDLKLETANPTGLEKFRVELVSDSLQYIAYSINNETNFGWDSILLDISSMASNIFYICFYVYGDNSLSVTKWYLDNIQVKRECKSPRNFMQTDYNGYCSGSDSSCSITMAWEPPECMTIPYIMELIFDDASAENGWAINPGILAWMGNKFPVETTSSGLITSCEIWFDWGASSTEELTIDVFDQYHNLLGSSAPFYTPAEDWLLVPINNIPFNGPFYAMVKWNMLTSQTNYLGYDENGPYALANLSWYFDGVTWQYFETAAGTVPGVFLLRTTVTFFSEGIRKKGIWNTDSTSLRGYNIYYDEYWDQSPNDFIKINQTLVTDTFYTHYISCFGLFYVTAVYSDSCESLPSDYMSAGGCYTGLPELPQYSPITINPNPASDWIIVESSTLFNEIYVLDLLGGIRYTERFQGTLTRQIELPYLAPGTYIVSIQTKAGPVTRKLVITN